MLLPPNLGGLSPNHRGVEEGEIEAIEGKGTTLWNMTYMNHLVEEVDIIATIHNIINKYLRIPISTHNRFSPLREERGPYQPQYGCMDKDDSYHYNRSPYNYNQNHPGPAYSGFFYKQQNGYIRNPDTNVDVEGEGAPRKRKCI